MDARRRRGIKKASLRQERQTAEDVGGRTQANSGAVRMGGGGDVRAVGKLRVECKFTEKDRYTLKLAELKKLKKQAIKTLEYPVLQFAFKFRNTFTKYAVTKYQTEKQANPCEAVTTWLGMSSIIIPHEELKKTLALGLLVVNLDGELYKIEHWDDFLKQFQSLETVSMSYEVRMPIPLQHIEMTLLVDDKKED